MKKIIIIVIVTFGFNTLSAQGSLWTLNWPITFAQGDTKDFIDQVSFRGISFDGRHFIQDEISIGGSIGWHVLYDKLRDQPPIHIENDGVIGDISGTQFRYFNAVPILANAHYYVDAGKSKAYFGAGVGTIYAEQRIDVGLTSIIDESWRFGLQPEIGLFMPFKYSDVGINFSLRYLYGTSAGDAKAISMMAVGIGIGWFKY